MEKENSRHVVIDLKNQILKGEKIKISQIKNLFKEELSLKIFTKKRSGKRRLVKKKEKEA